MLTKTEKQIEDMVLPDFVGKIPNGLFKVNFSDLKTRARVFMLNNEGELTFEGFVQTLIAFKELLTARVTQKRCSKCKGTVFDRIKETELNIFVLVDWKCLNCGNIEHGKIFSESYKQELKDKEKEVDTDIVSTIESAKPQEEPKINEDQKVE